MQTADANSLCESDFLAELFSHDEDLWTQAFDATSARTGTLAVWRTENGIASHGLASALQARLDAHGHQALLVGEDGERAPGLRYFEGLANRLVPEGFSNQVRAKLPLEGLNGADTPEAFANIFLEQFRNLNPEAIAQHSMTMTDALLRLLTENFKLFPRTHIVLVNPPLDDSSVFRVLYLLLLKLKNNSTLAQPVIWIVLSKTNPAERHTQLLVSLLRLAGVALWEASLRIPSVDALARFLARRLNAVERHRSDKVLLQILRRVSEIQKCPVENLTFFETGVWAQAVEEALSGKLKIMRKAEPDRPRPDFEPNDDLICELLQDCRFREIQELAQRARSMSLLHTHALALSLWFEPAIGFRTWFDEQMGGTAGPEVRALLMPFGISLGKIDVVAVTLTELSRTLPAESPLQFILAIAEMMLARLRGQHEYTERAISRLKHLTGGEPWPTVEAALRAADISQRLRGGVTLDPSATPFVFGITNDLFANALENHGRRTMVPALSTLRHLFENSLEVQARFLAPGEQRAHLGRLARILADEGHFSEALRRAEEALEISKVSPKPFERAYALRDLISVRLQGGVIERHHENQLHQVINLFSKHSAELERWKSQALLVLVRFSTGVKANELADSVHALEAELGFDASLLPLLLRRTLPFDVIRLTQDDQASPDQLTHLLRELLPDWEQSGPRQILTTSPVLPPEVLLAKYANRAGVPPLDRALAARRAREVFFFRLFHGWRSSAERRQLRSGPLARQVLSLPHDPSGSEIPGLIQIALMGAANFEDPRDLVETLTVLLGTIFGATEVSMEIPRSPAAGETQHGFKRICGKRESHQSGAWKIALTELAPKEGGPDWIEEGPNRFTLGKTEDLAILVINEPGRICMIHKLTEIFLELKGVEDTKVEQACRGLDDGLPVLFCSLGGTFARLRENQRLLKLQKDAERIAAESARLARGMSHLLEREYQNANAHLAVTNAALKATTQRLEIALQLTRDLLIAPNRHDACLRAAARLSLLLPLRDPCFVEIWFRESNGQFNLCRIEGVSTLTFLAEHHGELDLQLLTLEEGPEEFPDGSLASTVLASATLVRGNLSIPLVHEDKALALMRLGPLKADTVSDEDLFAIDTLAHTLGTTLFNMQVMEEQRVRWTRTRTQLGQILVQLHSLLNEIAQLPPATGHTVTVRAAQLVDELEQLTHVN